MANLASAQDEVSASPVNAEPSPSSGEAPAQPGIVDRPPPATTPKIGTVEAALAASGNGPSQTKERTTLPWHGSILLFDQSVTTPTVGIGADYQSANPVYEWWFAFKPRYSLYESKTESLAVSLWMNLYLELTNSDSTTAEHELVLGPTWISAIYGRTLFERDGYRTSFSVGPRFGLPTDKASRNSGQIMGLGLSAGLSQSIPLAGDDAPMFNSVRFGVSSVFNHPIGPKTAINSDIRVLRQSISDGRTVISDVLRGSMNVANSFTLSLSGDLRITKKLAFSASYSFLNSWVYSTGGNLCTPPTGCVEPLSIDAPTTHRASNWFLASVDYDAADEFSLGFGYYNLTGQLGPDGQRRSPLWSPDARLFFTITASLDSIYQALSKKPVTTATVSTSR